MPGRGRQALQAQAQHAVQPHIFVDVAVTTLGQPVGVGGGPTGRRSFRRPAGHLLLHRRLEAVGSRGAVRIKAVTLQQAAVGQLAQPAAALGQVVVILRQGRLVTRLPQEVSGHAVEGVGEAAQGAQPRLLRRGQALIAAVKGGGKGAVVVIQGVAAGGGQLRLPTGQEAVRGGRGGLKLAGQQGDGQGMAIRYQGHFAGQGQDGVLLLAAGRAGAVAEKEVRPGEDVQAG